MGWSEGADAEIDNRNVDEADGEKAGLNQRFLLRVPQRGFLLDRL